MAPMPKLMQSTEQNIHRKEQPADGGGEEYDVEGAGEFRHYTYPDR